MLDENLKCAALLLIAVLPILLTTDWPAADAIVGFARPIKISDLITVRANHRRNHRCLPAREPI
jgi:hypothetical protein